MGINEKSKVWHGVFKTFSDAAADDDVFEDTIWLDKIADRARSMLDASEMQGSIPFAVTSDYALPFVAALEARPGKVLRILDWGGGMGTSYLPLISMLPKEQPLQFVIVENKAVCELGRDIFNKEQQLDFVEYFPADQLFDIVHLGSSIQYVDDWRGVIKQFAGTKAKYLLVPDFPGGDIETFVTTQLFYGKRIPVRFWNLKEFTTAVEDNGFELIFKSAYRGYYLDPDAELPTLHFDSKHRLKTFCQLIFRCKDVEN